MLLVLSQKSFPAVDAVTALESISTEDVGDVLPLLQKCLPTDNCHTKTLRDAFNSFTTKLQDRHNTLVSWAEGIPFRTFDSCSGRIQTLA